MVDFGVVVLAGGLVWAEARADFEYVPPIVLDENAPVLAGVAPPPELRLDDPTVLDAARVEAQVSWEVRAGSLLGDVLEEWGDRSGVEVVMLTDREYQIESSHVFNGEFMDAVRTLLFGLGHFSHAPVGRVLRDGTVLAIFHRGPGKKAG